MLVDLKNGKKFYSPDEQKVKAMHDALVAALRALDSAIKATVVAQSLAAVLCMVYEVSGHRHAADAMETWFVEELEWPTDERDVEAANRACVPFPCMHALLEECKGRREQAMPIREMLYYIYMSDGFEGDAVNRASRARVNGWVPAGQ